MRRAALLKIGAAVTCAISLNGCVAVALPALAGAAIGGGELRSSSNGAGEAEDETVSEAAAEVAMPQEEPQLAPSPVLASPTPGNSTPTEDDLLGIEDTKDVTVLRGPLPAPGGSITADIDTSAFDSLVRYASKHATSSAPGTAKFSAYLEKPSALDGKRAECIARSAMVLIDLDPEDSDFAPSDDAKAPAAFSEGLAELRDKGVTIAWISRASVWFAGDIRVALKRSGLDPAGKDQLILMRYPGDRKQTRRKDLAGSACVIAIAGDTREDFDELYEYLKRPEAAGQLEALIGNGWFLIPQIFAEGDK